MFANGVSQSKADIRNPLSLLAHERSRFATCQWELLTPTDISIPLTHRLVLYALEARKCLFCVHVSLAFFSFYFHSLTNTMYHSVFLDIYRIGATIFRLLVRYHHSDNYAILSESDLFEER